MNLRPYQQVAIDRLRASYSAGKRAPLFVLPTGGGKTYTFANIAQGAAVVGTRVLIVVHRQELLRQASGSLHGLGVPHGLIAPGFSGEREKVAVASIQTLDRRLRKNPVNFDLIIIDEAHHAGAKTWERVMAHFPVSKLLGVTATPVRLDGRGLGVAAGGMFDDLILGPSISELIEQGFLVPPVVYAYPNSLDLTGVKRSGGDFNQKQIAGRVDKPSITGCAVDHYRRLSPGEPAIAFCASIEHAMHVANQFKVGGFTSEVIHGGLPDGERARMIAGLASGEINVLASVDLISEGTDIPVCSVAILLRPTQSPGLYLQQCGRILRPAPGKERGLVLDHVGNCLRHGLPDDDRDWTLDGERKRKKSGDSDVYMLHQCKKCFAVWEAGNKCPFCGHINPVEARRPIQTEGELQLIDKDVIAARTKKAMQEFARAQSLAEMIQLCSKYNYSSGYAVKRWNARHGKQRRTKNVSKINS